MYELRADKITILEKGDMVADVSRFDQDEAIVTIHKKVSSSEWSKIGLVVRDAIEMTEMMEVRDV